MNGKAICCGHHVRRALCHTIKTPRLQETGLGAVFLFRIRSASWQKRRRPDRLICSFSIKMQKNVTICCAERNHLYPLTANNSRWFIAKISISYLNSKRLLRAVLSISVQAADSIWGNLVAFLRTLSTWVESLSYHCNYHRRVALLITHNFATIIPSIVDSTLAFVSNLSTYIKM